MTQRQDSGRQAAGGGQEVAARRPGGAATQRRERGRGKRRERKSVPRGLAYIQSSFNNTTITLTDPSGNVIACGSSGSAGFRGSRKGTPYAAGLAAESAARKGMEHGLRQVDVLVRGPGSSREAAIRSLQTAGLNVLSIRDVTPVPHNGCRPPKRRRV